MRLGRENLLKWLVRWTLIAAVVNGAHSTPATVQGELCNYTYYTTGPDYATIIIDTHYSRVDFIITTITLPPVSHPFPDNID